MKFTQLFVCALISAGSMLFADSINFTTGSPDGLMGTASRPDAGGLLEIESADDFILGQSGIINHATFTGLLTPNVPLSNIGNVVVEIYRVFPNDSTFPPSNNVPTRANSPSDVEFDSRDATSGGLSFTTSILSNNFTVANTVINGINKSPNQRTLGEGPATGVEVQFDLTFLTPFSLPADHYFLVPQVELTDGTFLWLSAPKPTVPPFVGDLQSWVRNENLAPDWLRIGGDIVGGSPAPAFNASFSISGETAPEPSSFALMGTGLVAAFLVLRRRAWGR